MSPPHHRRARAATAQLLRLALLVAGATAQAKEADRDGLSAASPASDAALPDDAAARCAQAGLQASGDGLVIRTPSATCLRRMAPRLQQIIVVATATPQALAAAAPHGGSRTAIPLSRSTTTLRNLAVLRAQWQPPPATTLTSIGAR